MRTRGYAVAVEELEPGLWAVAAPVRDAGGSVIAALSISGPTLRLRDGLVDELGKLTKREAEHRVRPTDLRRTEARCRMTDDQIDLRSLTDADLVAQMHDDLYDGLADEIVEGTEILLGARAGRPTRC